MSHKIAVIGGDGIDPRSPSRRGSGRSRHVWTLSSSTILTQTISSTGSGLSPVGLTSSGQYAAILFGAVGDVRVPDSAWATAAARGAF